MSQPIDLKFQGVPGAIASFVFDTGDGLALVDTGPASTLPALRAGLEERGARLDDVRHLLLTHIHLDHAGAAGTLLSRLPHARVYVQARGAAHLQAPQRLMASAVQIYGDAMDSLWGDMLPVAAEQMTVLEGGETLRLGHLEVRPLYTPGHAVHHLAYHIGPDLYLGDVGGIRLDSRQSPRPPTPPPDIDLPAWKASIGLLRRVPAERIQLTHFGSYPCAEDHWDALEANIDIDSGVVRQGLAAGHDDATLIRDYTARINETLAAEGADLPARFAVACPPWMSVQGLARYWKRAGPAVS